MNELFHSITKTGADYAVRQIKRIINIAVNDALRLIFNFIVTYLAQCTVLERIPFACLGIGVGISFVLYKLKHLHQHDNVPKDRLKKHQNNAGELQNVIKELKHYITGYGESHSERKSKIDDLVGDMANLSVEQAVTLHLIIARTRLQRSFATA